MTRLRVVLSLALVFSGVGGVLATVTIPAEFREVVTDAQVIVRGLATDVRSVVVPGSGIDSVATFAVESVVKGEASGFVSVRVPGGTVGRTRFVMVGAPVFAVGDRAVLFLKRGADSFLRPIGLTQGVFRVQPEPTTGRAAVHPPLVGGRTAAAAGPAVRGDPRRRMMPVSEFESLIRQVMASPPGQAIPRGGR